MKVLLVGLLMTGCALAQNPSGFTAEELAKFTNGTGNGRLWKALTAPLVREGVIVGIWTAAFFIAPRNEALKYKPSNLETKEVIVAVDRFYKEPENLAIAIMDALRVVTLKTNGADPDTVARIVSEMRRKLAESQKPQ